MRDTVEGSEDRTLIGEATEGADDGRVAPAAVLGRGTSIGRYLVLGTLGKGGMGVVYSAYDPELDRRLAIKLLLATGRDTDTPSHRLLREAQAMAKLDHPNVVAVHDVGAVRGQVYLAMELVDGTTLARWLADREHPWREIRAVFVQAGRGLAAAHAAGLVHRDFKPENVMVDAVVAPEGPRARVMDFGLVYADASVLTTGETPIVTAALAPSLAEPLRLTRTSGVMGTPRYMAPEQFAGRTSDPRTDQFSFCVALWEGMFRAPPFAGDTMAELAFHVGAGTLRQPEDAREVPAWLRRVLERGLRADPAERWPSMTELLQALLRDPPRRRARVAVVGAAVVLAGALGFAAMSSRDRLCTGARAEIAAIWDARRRAEAEAAVVAGGGAYGAGLWQRIGPRVDAWADAWVQMHTDACAATRVRGDQSEAVMDLRMACLRRASFGLDALAQALVAADKGVVENAHTLVGELPSVEHCSDVAALQSEDPPVDPRDVDAVERAQADVLRTYTQSLANDLDAALATLERVEATLASVDYPPAAIDALLARAALEIHRGEYRLADVAATDAQALAAEHRMWRRLCEATTLRVLIGGYGKQPGDALALHQLALGLCSDDSYFLARAHAAVGGTFLGVGRYAEAEQEFRDALELFAGLSDPPPEELLEARNGLALAMEDQAKWVEAERELLDVHAGLVEMLGPDHPHVAVALNNIATVLADAGRSRDAIDRIRESLDVALRSMDAGHPFVAIARSNLAYLLKRTGDFAAAQREAQTAVESLRASVGESSADYIAALSGLAGARAAAGQLEQATDDYRHALLLYQRHLGPEHPNTGTGHDNLGGVLLERGLFTEAEREIRASVAVRLATLASDHPTLATTRLLLARTLFGQGKLAEAEQELRLALAILVKRDPPDVGLARVSMLLGRVLLQQGRAVEARAPLERAWALREPDDTKPVDRAETGFLLAQAIVGTDADRARNLAKGALADLGGEKSDLRAPIEAWLRSH